MYQSSQMCEGITQGDWSMIQIIFINYRICVKLFDKDSLEYLINKVSILY